MSISESAVGRRHAFEWSTYSVSRARKEPLLRFITMALEMRGCSIVYSSEANQAPFYVVFETPAGDRHGILAYAFYANANVIKGRPDDEQRFQIKYGSKLKGVLDVAIDPNALITTIMLGIEPKRGVFIAVDPLMNTPAPMSRSVEFKSFHIETILDEHWVAWERDRRAAKSKDRRAYELGLDVRSEVLVGARQEHLLDLILLERIARGLDPGERHLVADKMKDLPSRTEAAPAPHALLEELGIAPDALFDLIQGAGRLKMAVRGWVAEVKLEDMLKALPGVDGCRRIEAEGQPDILLRRRGGAPFLIECKNTLRERYADGRPKVDFQRTRASKADPCSRYYSPNEFQVLAACLHAVTEAWEFCFALTAELPRHNKCLGPVLN